MFKSFVLLCYLVHFTDCEREITLLAMLCKHLNTIISDTLCLFVYRNETPCELFGSRRNKTVFPVERLIGYWRRAQLISDRGYNLKLYVPTQYAVLRCALALPSHQIEPARRRHVFTTAKVLELLLKNCFPLLQLFWKWSFGRIIITW